MLFRQLIVLACRWNAKCQRVFVCAVRANDEAIARLVVVNLAAVWDIQLEVSEWNRGILSDMA